MLFIQSAGVFFLAIVLSRYLLLQRSPTGTEVLLCCAAIAILALIRLIVHRVSNDSRGEDEDAMRDD